MYVWTNSLVAFVDITSDLLLVSFRYWESSSKLTEAGTRSTLRALNVTNSKR